MAIGLGMVAALGYGDAAVRPDLAPLVYLAPVSFVAWYAGSWAGALVVIASAGAWLLTERVSPPSPPVGLPGWDVAVRGAAFLVLAHLVAALRASLERARELARTDPLTGVRNARAFYELADAEIARAKRYQHPFTAAYLDLDDFQVLNDQRGRHAGDAVLRAVARAITGVLRKSDVVARVGGEEFCVLLPETGAAPARLVVEKLRQALADIVPAHGWRITASIGVVTYLVPPASVDGMLREADRLMYAAKQSGKNAVAHETQNTVPVGA